MNKKKTIIIERKSAFNCALDNMHVVIDNIVDKKLSNGESITVEISQNEDSFDLHAQDHVFKVVNLEQVQRIILQFSFAGGIKCLAVYKDGNIVDLSNKNPGVFTNKTIYIILLLFIALCEILKHM